MTPPIRLSTGVLLVALGGRDAEAESFWSQFADPDDGRFDASRFLADNNAYGFLPLPIIITDPAVDGGLGAVGLFFLESKAQKEKRREALRNADDGARYLLTPSVSAAAAAVTSSESWFVGRGSWFWWVAREFHWRRDLPVLTARITTGQTAFRT